MRWILEIWIFLVPTTNKYLKTSNILYLSINIYIAFVIHSIVDMKTVLVLGATRNLGKSLVQYYQDEPSTVIYATARYTKPDHYAFNIHWVSGIDISHEDAGSIFALHYNHEFPIDVVYLVASCPRELFAPESLDKLQYNAQIHMYRTSAIGPLFFIQQLVKYNLLASNAKIVFIGNEAGSISLQVRGGNFGFHGSQAALNMVARLLSFDLAPKGIAIGVVYPGLIIPEGETKHVRKPGEVRSGYAARKLVEFVESTLTLENTGQLFSSRGFR